MVETITPVVHGGRRSRWALFLAMHAAGATLAAAAFGALLGGLGALLGAPWGWPGALLVATIAGLYLAREAFGLPVPVPQLRRQVPDWWRTFFPFGPASFLYGVGLGVGFLTYLAHGTLVAVSAAAVAGGRPLLGAALVAPFGLARGLSASVAIRARTPEEGSVLVETLARSASHRAWRLAHVVALGAVAVLALLAMRGPGVPAELGEAAAAVVAAVFAAAGVAKTVRMRAWRRALASYRLPRPVERVAGLGVPAVELAIAAFVFLGLARTAGVVSSVVLGGFSAAVVAGRARLGRRLDCGCFGRASARDYRLLLLRNGAVAAAAAVAWARGVDAPTLGSLGPPTGGEVLPAALVVVGIALATGLAAAGAVAARRGASR
ncbi:MAG TPA: MauE/DoxX family redox-associated membrane protein [Actinomycetota bacterium]